MKNSPSAFGPLSKKVLLSVLSGVAMFACTRRNNAPEELPSGRFVRPEVPVTPAQNKSLSEELEAQLVDALAPIFAESFAEQQIDKKIGQANTGRASRALAITFSKDVVARVQRSTSTHCVASPDKTSAYLSCLVFEVVEDNLATERDAQRWLSAFSRVKDNAGKLLFSDAEAQELAQTIPAQLVKIFASSQNVEKLLVRLTRSVDSSLRALEILAAQQVSLDMPYLAESFIKDRRYVLTTSLQQGSVGSSRVFNLDSMIVRFEINSNRLLIIRSGDGLYSGSSQEDLIVGSYPIVRTVRPDGQPESFYQVDFSRPENKSFLVSALGSPEPSLQLSADVVVPRVAHAPKPTLGLMNNGLYFTKQDPNLVIDQLVLINGNAPIFGDDDEPQAGAEVSKDPIRPTAHVVQGFFPLPAGNDPFEMKQALPLDLSQQELRARGVNDRTEGKDVPFFSTRGMYESNGGRARKQMVYVRKFNFEKETTFVLSRNVPAPLVPVLKSSVLSYKELFEGLTPQGSNPPVIRVLTQDEFEAANRTEGLAIGGAVIAADPRVNMIYWDDSFDLGSAWATAVENPKTGEIISGDVMLSGSMWSMEGCKGYFQRTWQKDKEPNLPKRPAGTVPSPVSRFLWDAKCDAALTNLGIFRARTQPSDTGANKDAKLAEFDRANRTGDLVTLARHASELLGRSVSPDEMVSELTSERSPGVARSGAVEQLSQAFDALQGGSADLQSKVKARAERLQTLLANDDGLSSKRVFKNGRNVIQARLDCVRQAMPNADINLSEAGAPIIESPFVNSPETGAMSLLRSVAVHELGHLFGLRHNFIASTTPAVLTEESKTPVAVDKGTDSVMDYNDYGIEMTAGAMRDFKSADGAQGLGTFGIYDVVALATAYGLPTDNIKFKTPAEFCTDRNVSTFGNCQRFDFGKDYNEYLVHRVNLILQRLRYANPLDAILDPRLPGVYAQLISNLSQELLKVNALWGLAQSAALETSEVAARDALLQTADFAFRGVGARQDFVKMFSAQYGADLIGAFGALKLPSTYFASPEYGELISKLLRREMDLNMIAVAQILQSRAKSRGTDSSYLGVVGNLSHRGQSYPYLDELIEHFSTRVVVPKGKAVAFEYLYDGQRKDGADATLDGKPFQMILEKPLFNHQAQILAFPNVVLDGPAPGSRKTVTVLVKGRASIEDMVRSVMALSALAVENPLHPAQSVLAGQAQVLQELLQNGGCTSPADDVAASAACETLKAEARAPAAVMLNTIMSAAQGALPTTTVASGEGR